VFVFAVVSVLAAATGVAQNRQNATSLRGVPGIPPPERPVVLATAEQPRIRVVPIARGLSHPWGFTFRDNGDILVTERDNATLRVIRNGVLDERAIPGVPEAYTGVRLAGLMDVALAPDDDQIVYLTYSKAKEQDGKQGATVALARGRLEGGALTEVRDLFVADGWGGGISASRIAFGPDGKLYMTVGGAFQFASTGGDAQDPSTHFGKLLRMNPDGTAPSDNPFVGNAEYLPEIYSMGHRNQLSLVFHPETGDLWATENGPQGGDEANIIEAGANYGWPVASYSRQYSGVPASETPWLPDFVGPEVVWWPSVAPSGMTFYTGEHFPAWRGDLFVGSMRVGRMENTGNIQRIVFNRRGQEVRREALLTELKQRIRDVRQGPDGYLYVLTEEEDAVLLRIEPARAIVEPPGSIVPARRLSEPRVPPLPEAEWTPEHRALVAKYAPDGNPGNALRTLLRVPALADRVFPLLNYVSDDSSLSPRHRTMLILRTAWLTQNANLWATHASRANEVGLTEEEVFRVAQGPVLRVAEGQTDGGWTEFEGVLIGMADQLFRTSAVNDATWELLSEQFDQHNMMDAVVTVNEITAQSVLFNTLGIQPDDDLLARIPTNDVGYSVVVPDPEPPLAAPRIEPVAGDELRIRRTLQRHPEIAAQWNQNPRYVLDPEQSRLTPHDRELLILRTGWNCQAVYEWAKHVGSVGRARDHGLEPLWIAQGGDADGWNQKELMLIDAANEMYRDSIISGDTWTALSDHFDPHQLISIAATASRYRKVSMTLNAFGVQPLPDDERFPVLEGY
jgi:glucose/arabinose dehydrogenase/alkylhydroperoxidase family enzyme